MELKVKNKRLKISPKGVITLPVSARKALGMVVNEPSKVNVYSDKDKVVLTSKLSKKDVAYKVSKKGMMTLRAEAKEVLSAGKNRHYWMSLDDGNKKATLYPF